MSEHSLDKLDRAAILARRAALVASALSTLTLTTSAGAQELPPPDGEPEAPSDCAPRERTPEEMAAARVHARAAAEALELQQFAEAARLYQQAYQAYPSSKLLIAWMDALVQGRRPEAAFQAGLAHVLCGGEDIPAVRAKIAELESQSGRLVIVLVNDRPGAPASVSVDGNRVSRERMRDGVFVAAGGEHVVQVRNQTGREQSRNVEVQAGRTTKLELPVPPDAEPQVCLSVCLSMMRTRVDQHVRLDVGIIPPFAVVTSDEPTGVVVGDGARVSICARITDKLWFEGDLFGFFFADRTTRVVPVGSAVELRYYIVDSLASVGLGLAGGYMFNLTDERYEERGFFRASPFVGPVITPIHFDFGVARIAFRMHAWVAEANVAGIESFQLAVAAPHLVFSFGDFVDRTESSE